MEFEKKEKNPNPWDSANFFSRLLFWWVIPLFEKGTKGNLKLSDIYDCPDIASSEKNGEIMQKEWDQELIKIKNGKHPSLIKAVIRVFGSKFCLNATLAFVIECVMHVMQPVLLGYLVSHFSRKKILSTTDLCLVTAGICLMSISLVIVYHTYFFRTQRMGMRIRIACCTLIYRKALKLSPAALGRTTVGQMVNLLSNDVNRFDNCVTYIPYFIIGPIHTVIVLCVLWTHIGYASLASLFVLMLHIFLQSIVGKLSSKFRLKTAGLTDHRIRLMNDIVAGMRIIKMYGWELPFAKLVDLSRRKEIKVIRRAVALRSVNVNMHYAAPKAILLTTFAVFLLCTDEAFTPEKVFVCMALLNSLRQSMTLFFYFSISMGAECIVSLRRIQKFLLLEECSETSLLDISELRPRLHDCGIWINNIRASWNKDNQATLRDVSLSVKHGELVTIVGPVGSGKTSLLMSILAELPITSGKIKVRGKVAYASQEPWVFSGSIRQNILFGSDFDETKYKKVLNISTLDKDIEMLPYGDETLVGERGVCLSGGQKARVNLARAMYFDADIFLLDDPLSAVDSAVSKHLFEKCINGYLGDKIRILVTHQIQFLKSASQILVLKEGGCLAFGTYEQLMEAGVDLGSLNKGQRMDKLAEDVTSLSPYECTYSNNPSVVGYNEENTTDETLKNVPKICEETKSSGSVKIKVYIDYIKSGASLLLRVIVVFSYITSQAFFNSTDLWLARWTRLEQHKYNIKDCWIGANKTFLNQTGLYNDTYGTFDRNIFRETVGNISDDCVFLTENYLIDEFDADQPVNRIFNLSVFAGLVVATFLFSFIRSIFFFQMCINASITLHNNMFKSVFRTPIAFFDSNPVGRILNRFAKDVGTIDEALIITLGDTVTIFCLCIGVVSVVAIIQPWLLLPTAFIISVMVLLRRLYLPTARDIKRYEGITRSPVFSHLSTSLNGLTTIRAFKLQTPFEITFDHYQDQHTATFFMYMAATRGFGMLLNWLCAAYSICVAIVIVVLFKDPSYASKAGLAIACTFELGQILQWGVRQSAEAESQMTSVERIMEYSNMKHEAALESKHGKKPPKNWPSRGFIVYKNVSLRYSANEPPILKNLNFEIYPEEKIGIVGRTGAGKSSIIATLFRMTESEGIVKIDGIYTKDIGLHDLRKRISIIPQDPILFTGPVRRNLDPFSEHSDDDLWQALEEAYLKQAIEEMPKGLDTEVAEGGANFSVGQKQLICLARALLRRNKILVLDEATANVDPNTDRLIQQTIRDRFAYCTVLTIAHRLHTVMDSDRVLVLDAGEVKEFDSPFNLLQNPRSLFSQMLRMTGPGMAKQLLKVAHSAYMKNAAKKEGSTNVFGGSHGNDINDMNATAPYFAEGRVNEGFQQTESTHL